MTSTNFHISYASVANTLFEHIEQDLLLLTTALLDDDEDLPPQFDPYPAPRLTHDSMPPP